MSATLSYVFCLVRAARRPALGATARGMPGGSDRRAIAVGDQLWAIVETVRERDYSAEALARGLQNLKWVGARAVAHERVIERFLSAPAILPMQLFTMFTSDERVVDHVRADRRRIGRILKRIDRKVEWGLRLTWDAAAAREKIEERYADLKGPRRNSSNGPRRFADNSPGRSPHKGPSGADLPGPREKSAQASGGADLSGPRRKSAQMRSGADLSGPREKAGSAYLARKRDLLDVNRALLVEARAQATRLFRAVSREASAALRRTSLERAAPGSRLLLDAAFLVPAAKAAAFRASMRKYTRAIDGSGVAVSVSGPWPPYNFIDQPSRAPAAARPAR